MLTQQLFSYHGANAAFTLFHLYNDGYYYGITYHSHSSPWIEPERAISSRDRSLCWFYCRGVDILHSTLSTKRLLEMVTTEQIQHSTIQ